MTKYQTEMPEGLTVPEDTHLMVKTLEGNYLLFQARVNKVYQCADQALGFVIITKWNSLQDVINYYPKVWVSPTNTKPKEIGTKDASTLCLRASELLAERGKQYDGSGKERSMASTVAAFNAVYGTNLTEQQGWHFMVILKMVRQRQGGHIDSAEDMIAYAALAAENTHLSLA